MVVVRAVVVARARSKSLMSGFCRAAIGATLLCLLQDDEGEGELAKENLRDDDDDHGNLEHAGVAEPSIVHGSTGALEQQIQ